MGPEGGWSSKEINTIVQQDALAIRFGERILRTETAGIALVSASASLLNLI
ncbi:RsmE family RNA methyltransferase [Pelistega indica]|uniref:RsmE family RNA methyltransferase n=1 Tax=Pelistega indica TaxID=1414851 RepID=UPI0028FC8A65|nr:RsmE family RNA methyltransferase [Pelistega indica]